jgi:ABC-type polysaccharide/polyol phosphate export permease
MLKNSTRLTLLLGWQDIRQRYRRSVLGQFWITISIGVMVLCLALLFGRLFQAPLAQFLPFLAIGLICWNFISSTVAEGCNSFIAAEGIIKQLSVPLSVHVKRVIWRNLVVFAHNLVIIPVVFFSLGMGLSGWALLFLPGLLLLTLNLLWVSMLLGLVCTRFRDMPQIVQSIMQIAFYLTPIIWLPELLKNKAEFALVEYNPLYHLIELVRAPLLGSPPTLANWVVGLGLFFVGGLFTLWFSRRLGHRVAYWL